MHTFNGLNVITKEMCRGSAAGAKRRNFVAASGNARFAVRALGTTRNRSRGRKTSSRRARSRVGGSAEPGLAQL